LKLSINLITENRKAKEAVQNVGLFAQRGWHTLWKTQ